MRTLALIFPLILTSVAFADDIIPPDPWEVIHTARTFGDAQVGRDNHKDPHIDGVMADEDAEETEYEIAFYGCRLGRNCATILFRTTLAHDDWEKEPPHLDLFDAWNRRKLIGRAFWSVNGTAILEHPVTMQAGLPKETLVATFQAWQTAVNDYKEFLDFPVP